MIRVLKRKLFSTRPISEDAEVGLFSGVAELLIARTDLATLPTTYDQGTIATDEYGNSYELQPTGWTEKDMRYAIRPVTIALNAQISNAIINNVSGGIMTIFAPDTLNGTTCKLKVSSDGILPYKYLTDGAGADLLITLAAGKVTVVPNVVELAGCLFLQIEMTSIQTTARSFNVSFKG